VYDAILFCKIWGCGFTCVLVGDDVVLFRKFCKASASRKDIYFKGSKTKWECGRHSGLDYHATHSFFFCWLHGHKIGNNVCVWLKCSNLSSPSDLINVNSLRCEEFKTHSCIDRHLFTFHCILHLSQQVILNIELTVF
jgi:hypothetical protein